MAAGAGAGASAPVAWLLAAAVAAAALAASASAQSGCTTTLISLYPCLNYISGNVSTPPPSCCSQLASVVQTSPQCLCAALSSDSSSLGGVTIDRTRALQAAAAPGVQRQDPAGEQVQLNWQWIEGDADGAVPNVRRRVSPGRGEPGASIRGCHRLCHIGHVTDLARLSLLPTAFGDSDVTRSGFNLA
ncbi:putative bifunctional inhibitor/LTP/seed storage protein family isoform X1 [Zea mays]|uniref:Bifunctional inhibitor/lipid-transfer protein/seed storage 2S albumin superfamily protein n=1 Tax=Zea mays TaxID=4577 RepID=A0A1D6GFQ4_MAIZE|nr:putative bifunctional inhibitor/LTP/seed storage protein family isoform X1 [Zea mays]AQK62398.1 Bifunctional inhibitor/lipid-transfer protein/seed storage 2S albumin superfamily protein [Zea mays]|eukprot:XP_023158179.1 putative bifunctional inhibitor/LTP/seed storage protein family isoform X1 [Zea mays]